MSETIGNVISIIEQFAPLGYQENYDNAGLQIGDYKAPVSNVLVCIDITEDVIDEAISKKAELIVSHHPLIFVGIKRLVGNTYVERCITKAIRNNIAIYSAHTNLDAVKQGVNAKIAEKLRLHNTEALHPIENDLLKLVTFVPTEHAENVRTAIFQAGAGTIGNYDNCSFSMEGTGTFRGNEISNPFVGEKGKQHAEHEERIETILPKHLQKKIIHALLNSHPYEEVAYDLYPIINKNPLVGIGIIGELEKETDEKEFLLQLKKSFNLSIIKHTGFLGKKISKVAVCGGAGSGYLKYAIHAGADIFISGDFKYHDYFNAENKIVIADIGHYESEFFTKELFYDILTKKSSNFAVHLTDINTNPIKYF